MELYDKVKLKIDLKRSVGRTLLSGEVGEVSVLPPQQGLLPGYCSVVFLGEGCVIALQDYFEILC